MLAAHIDQENMVHAHQTAAAAKDHATTSAASNNNAMVGKTFGAKTPGTRAPKTPFKVPLNDENAPFQAGKSVLRTNGKGTSVADRRLFTGKKAVVESSAFVTPAGPRNRPALGAKTTNAKANVLLTPAARALDPSPSKSLQRTTAAGGSPRLRRPKVKIHQPEALNARKSEQENEVPDVEYMPPREIPLPDYPSDDESHLPSSLPQFSSKNISRGWPSAYNDHEQTALEVHQAAESAARDLAEQDRKLDQSFKDHEMMLRAELGLPPKKPVKRKATGTMVAREAARALAGEGRGIKVRGSKLNEGNIAGFGKPGGLKVQKSKATADQIVGNMERPVMRHANAMAAAKSTIGYKQGRITSGQLQLRKAMKPASETGPAASRIGRDRVTKGMSSAPGAGVSVTTEGPLERSASTSSQEFFSRAGDVVEALRLGDLSLGDDEAGFGMGLGLGVGVGAGALEEELEEFEMRMPGVED